MSLARVETKASPAAAAAGPAVHVVTFGCQMNKYDSLLVEGRFVGDGYRLVASMEEADVVLFNTCAVREHAEERVYSWLGELKRRKREHPDLVVGVLGCMAQRAEEEIFERAGHVDLVVGTRRFHQLPELVDELRARRAAGGARPGRPERLLATEMDGVVAVDRAREVYTGGLHGYLAVMRGCDLNCTYCIVPRTRGRVASRPIAELVAEARWMVEQGVRVITLLGQTLNSYGEDFDPPMSGAARGAGRDGRPALADLLRALEPLAGLERIRMITLHPSYVTRELARAIADCAKVERFLPLPLQSGSDHVLRRMKRGYNLELYRRRIAILREEVPDIELSSDWIVGFPGETDADFEQSERALAEFGFAQSFVFRYSPRPGTAAADLSDDVPEAIKAERNTRLLAAAEQAGRRRMERQIGSTKDVLAEEPSERRAGSLRGRTREGLAIGFPGPAEQVGSWFRVRVEHASPYALSGTLV
ncbi:MAG: tRNA (N6-isopentenyl adenosine(37)-C2)-methylthiotransferase MiaB [Planctomycetes bacterium]|nr:tRNA (N6-isopentenyl adenosine(37)-C2)-methylthiotransferase MiaB [Planctomycetota bacterium]